MQKPDYKDGVNDMECVLHSSFADLYDELIKEFPLHKSIISNVVLRVRNITTHHSKILRGDTK